MRTSDSCLGDTCLARTFIRQLCCRAMDLHRSLPCLNFTSTAISPDLEKKLFKNFQRVLQHMPRKRILLIFLLRSQISPT